MDNNLDNIAGLPHPDKELFFFRETIVSLDLHNIWRTHHLLGKQCIWFRPNPFTARRLGYIFCDTNTLSKLTTSTKENKDDTRGSLQKLKFHTNLYKDTLTEENSNIKKDT